MDSNQASNTPANGDAADALNQPSATEQPETPETADQFWNNNSDLIRGFNLKPRPRHRKFLNLNFGNNSSLADDKRYIIVRLLFSLSRSSYLRGAQVKGRDFRAKWSPRHAYQS